VAKTKTALCAPPPTTGLLRLQALVADFLELGAFETFGLGIAGLHLFLLR
jgi:hypothetical protein